MNKAEAIEALVDSIFTRTSIFTHELNKTITNPKVKVISVHEFLLFLIHHIDKIAFLKGLHTKCRITIREEILRELLNREILPPKTEEKLIADGIKPSLTSFGTTPSIAIEALLPLFHKQAIESDKYYSGCDTFVGKYPSDGKGLINRLVARISERTGEGEGIISSMLMIDVTIKAVMYKDALKKDNQALDILKLCA